MMILIIKSPHGELYPQVSYWSALKVKQTIHGIIYKHEWSGSASNLYKRCPKIQRILSNGYFLCKTEFTAVRINIASLWRPFEWYNGFENERYFNLSFLILSKICNTPWKAPAWGIITNLRIKYCLSKYVFFWIHHFLGRFIIYL